MTTQKLALDRLLTLWRAGHGATPEVASLLATLPPGQRRDAAALFKLYDDDGIDVEDFHAWAAQQYDQL